MLVWGHEYTIKDLREFCNYRFVRSKVMSLVAMWGGMRLSCSEWGGGLQATDGRRLIRRVWSSAERPLSWGALVLECGAGGGVLAAAGGAGAAVGIVNCE